MGFSFDLTSWQDERSRSPDLSVIFNRVEFLCLVLGEQWPEHGSVRDKLSAIIATEEYRELKGLLCKIPGNLRPHPGSGLALITWAHQVAGQLARHSL